MNELGQVSFWKLFLKPGRPFAFGHIKSQEGTVPFFGLPGNPVAAAITALQLLWPALQILEGQQEPEFFPRIKVKLANALARRPGRPELARARLEAVHHLKRQNGFTPIKSFQPQIDEHDSAPTNRLVLQNHPVTPTH